MNVLAASRSFVSKYWILIWILIGLILKLSVISIPLGIDEAGAQLIASHWASTNGSLYGQYWIDRPPVLLVIHFIAAIFGSIGLRILAAVSSFLTAYLIYKITLLVSDKRSARTSFALAVLLLSSGALGSSFAPGEIFAVLPATASVFLLIKSVKDKYQHSYMFFAGLLAAVAILTKQSFIDALVAGSVFLVSGIVWRGATKFSDAIKPLLIYFCGGAIALVTTLLWAATTSVGIKGFVYAVAGFRADALEALTKSAVPMSNRFEMLGGVVIGSGIIIVFCASLLGLWALRNTRRIGLTIFTWFLACMFGVLGGGYYWPHYLIQLIPVLTVLTGVGINAQRVKVRLLLIVLISIPTIMMVDVTQDKIERRNEVKNISAYLQDHAQPKDTLYVMYARANLAYYSKLSSPFPYLWSSMLIAKKDAEPKLQRWLSSSTCPTWIVLWQKPTSFGLDKNGVTRRVLRNNYVKVAKVDGKQILQSNGECRA